MEKHTHTSLEQTTGTLQTVALSEEDRSSLEASLQELSRSPYDSFENFWPEALRAVLLLPPSALRCLNEFRWNPAAPGALVIRNAPVDSKLPPTPLDDSEASGKQTWVTEGFLVGCAQLLGQIFGYKAERQGQLIQNVCPIPRRASSASSAGAFTDLELHTEIAFHPLRPEFLLLMCVREGVDAATYIADLYDVFSDVNESHIDALTRPIFRFRAPESFMDLVREDGETVQAIISRSRLRSGLCLNLNPGVVHATEEEGAIAIRALASALQSHSQAVHLQAGDLLILNNQHVVHGRSAFTARFDGKDRWLQRAYVSAHLWWRHGDPSYPERVIKNSHTQS